MAWSGDHTRVHRRARSAWSPGWPAQSLMWPSAGIIAGRGVRRLRRGVRDLHRPGRARRSRPRRRTRASRRPSRRAKAAADERAAAEIMADQHRTRVDRRRPERAARPPGVRRHLRAEGRRGAATPAPAVAGAARPGPRPPRRPLRPRPGADPLGRRAGPDAARIGHRLPGGRIDGRHHLRGHRRGRRGLGRRAGADRGGIGRRAGSGRCAPQSRPTPTTACGPTRCSAGPGRRWSGHGRRRGTGPSGSPRWSSPTPTPDSEAVQRLSARSPHGLSTPGCPQG